MFKKTGVGMLLIALAAPAWAGDAPKAEWKSFFETLVTSLKHSAASRYAKGGTRVIAVAAVRGAGQTAENPLKPYWKGGWSEKSAQAYKRQTEEFQVAAQLVLDGKADEGIAGLQAFKKAHPKSVLLPDVDTALKQAEAARQAQSSAAAKSKPGKAVLPDPAAAPSRTP